MKPYGQRVAVSHRSFALAPDPGAIARADEEVLLDLARQLGFDGKRFAADLRGEGTLGAVLAYCGEAARLGIHAVPSVLVGRRLIQGAVPAETYRAAAEAELSGAGGA